MCESRIKTKMCALYELHLELALHDVIHLDFSGLLVKNYFLNIFYLIKHNFET